MTIREVLHAFRALYVGGLAQQQRANGNPNAMPPWAETYWLGRQVVKCPMDLWVYQELLVETMPDLVIETGTSGSGSAFFFATIFDHLGHGAVVTVDKDEYPALRIKHPRIEYLVGDSVAPEVVHQVAERAAGRRTMLSMDSLHTYPHVAAELEAYAGLVSPGCYCVIEDVFYADGEAGGDDPAWGGRAVHEFHERHPEFERDLSRERHLMTSNIWLRRV